MGIGLRTSAALARIVMCVRDRTWGRIQLNFGLSIQLFCRYVDDLQFYLRPINRGWMWQDGGWSFRDNDHDDRDMYTRTVEEIGKSLCSIWKFVQFNTEGQKDYTDGLLNTLDFATRVESWGYIRYKFFSKPMASNVLLLMGTALSSS